MTTLQRRLLTALVLGATFCGASARPAAAAGEPPLGLWWNAEKTVHVEIAERDGTLTGTAVWLKNRQEDGSPFRDTDNPDPALRDRPIKGLQLFYGLEPGRRAGVWQGGSIYDPDTGNTYSCTLTRKGVDRLHIRGYLGVSFLGRTTAWTRVTPEEALAAEHEPNDRH